MKLVEKEDANLRGIPFFCCVCRRAKYRRENLNQARALGCIPPEGVAYWTGLFIFLTFAVDVGSTIYFYIAHSFGITYVIGSFAFTLPELFSVIVWINWYRRDCKTNRFMLMVALLVSIFSIQGQEIWEILYIVNFSPDSEINVGE